MTLHHKNQTAYQHNAHPSTLDGHGKDHGWDEQINRMIDQRYAFLEMQYDNAGFLFRGMSSGFRSSLVKNSFWHENTDDMVINLEQELGVLFISQDLSDALNIARFWENNQDACVLVFNSRVFNQALEARKAAMMATAEPGVVFKYPFITFPLKLNDIDFIIVRSDMRNKIDEIKSGYINKLIYVKSLDRQGVENSINFELEQRQIVAAKTNKNNVKPARID